MENEQQFGVSSSCFSVRKIQNLKKRKERDHHDVQSQVPTRFLPLFDEYPSWVKKPTTSSTVGSIVSSRTPGRVLKEPRIFYDNRVNKINSAGPDSRNIESAGHDSSDNEGLFSGLLPLFSENPSWTEKPRTSVPSSSIAASRNPWRLSQELMLFDDKQVVKNSADQDSRNKESAEELERRVAYNLMKMKSSYSLEDVLEERSRGVSTELSLYHHDPFKIKKKMTPSDLGNLCRLLVSAEELERRVASNLMKMKSSYGLQDLLEEGSRRVSTELSLYHHDPFKIKKKMTPSDLGNLCRLLVSANLVEKHILPFLNKDQIKLVEAANQEIKGLKVWVWDMNTESLHQLVFKRWSTSKSYIFNDGWTKEFVKRRNLVEGDEIGLYWDNDHSRFHFNVLSRAGVSG